MLISNLQINNNKNNKNMETKKTKKYNYFGMFVYEKNFLKEVLENWGEEAIDAIEIDEDVDEIDEDEE